MRFRCVVTALKAVNLQPDRHRFEKLLHVLLMPDKLDDYFILSMLFLKRRTAVLDKELPSEPKSYILYYHYGRALVHQARRYFKRDY